MIESLDELLKRDMKDARYIASLKEGIARFHEYRAALPFIPNSYTRTRLLRNEEYELVAMLWAPHSSSPIHDHGDSRCWVVILDGVLDVDNYDRLDDGGGHYADLRFNSSVKVTKGDLDHRLNRNELHRVRNATENSTYSLQIYSAPITFYRTVDERTRACGRLDAVYDAIYDLERRPQ